MAKLTNIERIINELKEENYLKEFINLTFNYQLTDEDFFEVYVQNIKDDDVIYIYDYISTSRFQFYEFVMEQRDVYLEKLCNKNIIINYVYIEECINLYISKKYINNLIRFVVAFFLDEKRKILSEYLPSYIVDIIIKNII